MECTRSGDELLGGPTVQRITCLCTQRWRGWSPWPEGSQVVSPAGGRPARALQLPAAGTLWPSGKGSRGPVLWAGLHIPSLAAATKLMWAFSRIEAETWMGCTAPSARCCRGSCINTEKIQNSTSRCFYHPVCQMGRQRHREGGDLWRPHVDQGKPQNHGEAHCVLASAAPLDPEVHPQPRSYSRGNGKS